MHKIWDALGGCPQSIIMSGTLLNLGDGDKKGSTTSGNGKKKKSLSDLVDQIIKNPAQLVDELQEIKGEQKINLTSIMRLSIDEAFKGDALAKKLFFLIGLYFTEINDYELEQIWILNDEKTKVSISLEKLKKHNLVSVVSRP
jgi:hypothetical protein